VQTLQLIFPDLRGRKSKKSFIAASPAAAATPATTAAAAAATYVPSKRETFFPRIERKTFPA